MTTQSSACHLRSLRRKSGLTQRELAVILGFLCEVPVSRHERSTTVPNVLTALGYEAVFHVPIAELFPGLYLTVESGIEERLTRMESELEQRTDKGRNAAIIARKLEFLWERKNGEPSHPLNETPDL